MKSYMRKLSNMDYQNLAHEIMQRMEELRKNEGTVDSLGNRTVLLARVLQEMNVTVQQPKPKKPVDTVFHYDKEEG